MSQVGEERLKKMTAKEIDKFRGQLQSLAQRLETDRRQLNAEASQGAGELDVKPGEFSVDDEVSPDNNVDEIATFGMIDNEVQLLNAVTAALDRIDQKTFGRCTLCGQSIDSGRLQALPYTPYCIACATESQAGSNAMAGTTG